MAIKSTYEELKQRVKKLEQEAVMRKQREKALRESEHKFHTHLQNTPIGAITWDLNFRVIEWNPAATAIFGYFKKEVLGKHPTELILPDEIKEEIDGVFKDLISEKGGTRSINNNLTKNGRPIICEWYNTTLRDTDGNVIGVASLVNDITDRKQAEEKLKQSEKNLSRMFQFADYMVCIADLEKGYFTKISPAFTRHLGWSEKEMLSKPILDFIHPDDIEKTADVIKEQMGKKVDVIQFENRYKTKKGDFRWFEWAANPIPEEGISYSVAYDITERKRAEEDREKLLAQLVQSQKMESIGTLAGGIAHDFNNILGIILGNIELAMDDVPEWNPASNNLDEVKHACLRAKDVVQQLLSFSRKSDQKQKPVNVIPIIKDALKFLRSSIPTNIEIRKSIPDELGIVMADPTQIHQVMLNICTNAAHAMSEDGGIMEISLSDIEIGKDAVNQKVGLNHGQYIKIIVSDTGHGIAKKHIDNIFDPYFTTKEVGKGSGIGLSVVHGILKSHNGSISVDSEYGKGTTFNVFLPVVEEEPALKEETNTTIPTGNERILVVDDEKPIATMVSMMLERLGYTVTAKTSSLDALATFQIRPDNFDLIISDMSMPKITGDRLAKKLQKVQPNIPIILCTGYSERINEEKVQSLGVRALVMKPIMKNELAKTIRKVLDGNQ